MDELAIHPYPNPNSPTDAPSVGYGDARRFGIPDLARVKQAAYDAFNGTAQPTTISRRKPLRLLVDEVGWQVDTTGLPNYYGRENVKTISPARQAQYLETMIGRYLACDPAVTDVLLFLLQDEASRDGRPLIVRRARRPPAPPTTAPTTTVHTETTSDHGDGAHDRHDGRDDHGHDLDATTAGGPGTDDRDADRHAARSPAPCRRSSGRRSRAAGRAGSSPSVRRRRRSGAPATRRWRAPRPPAAARAGRRRSSGVRRERTRRGRDPGTTPAPRRPRSLLGDRQLVPHGASREVRRVDVRVEAARVQRDVLQELAVDDDAGARRAVRGGR